MSEWISVVDKLPEEQMPVIAYIEDRDSVIVTYFFDDFALIRSSLQRGFTEHGVTHWMPLPPIPTKERS